MVYPPGLDRPGILDFFETYFSKKVINRFNEISKNIFYIFLGISHIYTMCDLCTFTPLIGLNTQLFTLFGTEQKSERKKNIILFWDN